MKGLCGIQSTVLLVDDDEDLLSTLGETLEPHFAAILLAADGAAARKILESSPVDIVVTDQRMPGMTGTQLVQWMQRRLPLVPVLILTANADDASVLAALRGGAIDILQKPFIPDILVNRIQNCLLYPFMTQLLWALMSREASVPSVEQFLQQPFPEQMRALYAYSAVLRSRGLLQELPPRKEGA